mgnify:CR=1 FL=1
MIKEIALPYDTQMTSPPALELGDLVPHTFGAVPLGYQMQMIRHQSTKADIKPAFDLSLRKTSPDSTADLIASQCRRTWTPAADRHEPEVIRIHPSRHSVRQSLSNRRHDSILGSQRGRLSPSNTQRMDGESPSIRNLMAGSESPPYLNASGRDASPRRPIYLPTPVAKLMPSESAAARTISTSAGSARPSCSMAAPMARTN